MPLTAEGKQDFGRATPPHLSRFDSVQPQITRKTRKKNAPDELLQSVALHSPNSERTGVSWGTGLLDLGCFEVTQREQDRGKFKTPSLRNVALTAPYMHDGSVATLEVVVDFYSNGANSNTNLDREIRPLNLTVEEKAAQRQAEWITFGPGPETGFCGLPPRTGPPVPGILAEELTRMARTNGDLGSRRSQRQFQWRCRACVVLGSQYEAPVARQRGSRKSEKLCLPFCEVDLGFSGC